jgi:hypothetical protein
VPEPSIADRGDDLDPVAVFKKRLQQFQVECGGPSIRDLERLFAKVGRPQSRSVIQAKLTGRTKPDWAFVESFVEACVLHAGTGLDPDLPMWRDRHTRMQVALAEQRRPVSPAAPAEPEAPSSEAPPPDELGRARADLAAVVARQWAAEAEARCGCAGHAPGGR